LYVVRLSTWLTAGNKCDKEVGGGRQVPRKEGEALARKLGTLFIETSAKTTTGVQDAFVEVVRKVIFLSFKIEDLATK
jgi:Ras-related protein Rab-18